MTDYAFVTVWRIEAPIDDVWNAINQIERMPSWWKYVESVVELEPGNEKGLGRRIHIVWTSALPYKLSFDMRVMRSEYPHVIELEARGELNGTGRWQLSQEGPVTVVRYDWNVSTSKQWMNVLAPLLRPVFAWNHDILMNEGGKSLARLLNARQLDVPEPQTTNSLRLLRVLVAVTAVASIGFFWVSRQNSK